MKAAYRLFLVTVGLSLALGLGGLTVDPMVQLGTRFHDDMTAWTSFHIIVSVCELCVFTCALLWLFRGGAARKAWRYQPGSLTIPLLVFAGTLLLGMVNGVILNNATMTEALWEVRGFLMLIAIYFLTGAFIRTEDHLNDLVWVVLIASTVLACDNILRWALFLRTDTGNDLAYDHIDSIVIVFSMLLCVCLLLFGGTARQCRYALYLIPVDLFAILMMRRRAAFIILAIGLAIVAVFLLRLRPRVFWRVVPIAAVAVAVYLVIFWNNTGALGQPARAISSMFTPDPRDASSNLYRMVEKANIISNIQLSPITGIGFGTAYKFFYLLPDLGNFWPFYHYETHNAILWIWMKGGAICFIAFWWLFGRAAYDGSRVVATQREEWSLTAKLVKLFTRKGESPVNAERREKLLAQTPNVFLRSRHQQSRRLRKGTPSLGLNVVTWERSDERASKTAKRTGTLALFITGICLIPMQIVFSYVDLGLNERPMLLLGLTFGILARGYMLLGLQLRPGTSRKSPVRLAASTPKTQPLSAPETQQIVRELVTGRPAAASRPLTSTAAAPAQTGVAADASPVAREP